jgi:hypothetical protein
MQTLLHFEFKFLGGLLKKYLINGLEKLISRLTF